MTAGGGGVGFAGGSSSLSKEAIVDRFATGAGAGGGTGGGAIA